MPRAQLWRAMLWQLSAVSFAGAEMADAAPALLSQLAKTARTLGKLQHQGLLLPCDSLGDGPAGGDGRPLCLLDTAARKRKPEGEGSAARAAAAKQSSRGGLHQQVHLNAAGSGWEDDDMGAIYPSLSDIDSSDESGGEREQHWEDPVAWDWHPSVNECLASLPALQQHQQQQREQLSSWISEHAQLAFCPSCETATLEEPTMYSVTLLAQTHCITAPIIPVYRCRKCSCRHHCSPLAVGYFTGNMATGMQIYRANSGQAPVWFAVQLLEQLSSLQYSCPRVSINGFAKMLRDTMDSSLNSPLLSQGKLEKHLGDAMDPFLAFNRRLQLAKTHGCPNYRLERGLLGACGGSCSLADSNTPLRSIEMDACMGFRRQHNNATVLNAANAAPALVERVIPVDEAHGSAFFPGILNVGRGTRQACLDIEEHTVGQRHDKKHPSTCSNWKAANEVAEAKQGDTYDEKGFFSCFCRHGVVILGMTMGSPERYSYGILALMTIVAIHDCLVGRPHRSRQRTHTAAWWGARSARGRARTRVLPRACVPRVVCCSSSSFMPCVSCPCRSRTTTTTSLASLACKVPCGSPCRTRSCAAAFSR